MKGTVKNALFVFGLTFVIACHADHQNHNINLNNGEKWKVNVEMKPHIEKGNVLLNEFIAQKETDFQELAESLKAQNNALIQSCTMQGESHDELHKWLHPHIGLIGKLSNAKNADEAEEVISEIGKSFKLYQTYFE